MVEREPQAGAVRLLVIKGDASYASQVQHHRVATPARCDGSLPSPLHSAIIRNDFPMMFPPAVTWTRAVGLRGHATKTYVYMYNLSIMAMHHPGRHENKGVAGAGRPPSLLVVATWVLGQVLNCSLFVLSADMIQLTRKTSELDMR